MPSGPGKAGRASGVKRSRAWVAGSRLKRGSPIAGRWEARPPFCGRDVMGFACDLISKAFPDVKELVPVDGEYYFI